MKTPPKPGERLEATITRIGSEGDGVGIYNDMNIIVPKTTTGDKVTCVVKYTTKDRIHANLWNINEAGNSRVPAPCHYYDMCGGCGLQHINADEYKNYKLQLLTNALKNSSIPLPSTISWFSVGEHSRRRAFVRFDKNPHSSSHSNEEEAYRLGFYEHQSHNVVDIKKCLILEPALELLLAPLKELSIKLGINVEGWMITNSDNGIDLTLHSDDKKVNNEGSVFAALSGFAKSHKIARLSWKRGDKIIPVITIANPELLINNISINLPSEYFLQASGKGQEAILNAVIPHVNNDSVVLDLFSGLGIYSFAIADKVKNVSAYEIAPEMIESMEINIRKHKLGNKVSAYCRDVEKFPLGRDELLKFDIAIINPPRTGALKQTSVLAAGKIKKIIMVSCNSGTFARDARILHENGYSLKSLSAIDQFYFSHHLEQVGVFVLSEV